MKKVSGALKIELAQFREIEGFSKLGASLDEFTKKNNHKRRNFN